MNFKIKKAYYRFFSVFLSIVMIVLSVPIMSVDASAVDEDFDGVCLFRNVKYNNKFIHINNNGTMAAEGEIIELHTYNPYWALRWYIISVGNGYYKIESVFSDKVLTAPTGYNNDIVTQTDYAGLNTQQWKFIEQSDGTYKISPKSNHNCYLVAGVESTYADQDLEIDFARSDGSDKWHLRTNHISVEFYYDQGFVTKAKSGSESVSATIANIENNIEDTYFFYVASSFRSIFGIDFRFRSVSNYTSDADNCPHTTGTARCMCITDSNCQLSSFDNPLLNNNGVGFTKSVHCKSLIRLRNNLMVNLPENTARIAYTGHHACVINGGHNYNAEGLSNYDYPIICMRYPVSPTNTRFVYLMAHEISHFYGLGHHNNGSHCIMDDQRTVIDIYDPSTFWCDDCIEAINSNKSKFYTN